MQSVSHTRNGSSALSRAVRNLLSVFEGIGDCPIRTVKARYREGKAFGVAPRAPQSDTAKEPKKRNRGRILARIQSQIFQTYCHFRFFDFGIVTIATG